LSELFLKIGVPASRVTRCRGWQAQAVTTIATNFPAMTSNVPLMMKNVVLLAVSLDLRWFASRSDDPAV